MISKLDLLTRHRDNRQFRIIETELGMCLRRYVDFESRAASRIANHIASHKSQNTFWKSNFDSLTLTIEIWRENFGGKSFDFLEK